MVQGRRGLRCVYTPRWENPGSPMMDKHWPKPWVASHEACRPLADPWPNNALQLTASSRRSCVAPASGSS
jgi:hypothetical protein